MANAKKVKKPELELSTGTGETIGSLATTRGIREAKAWGRPDRAEALERYTHTGLRKHELEDRTRRHLGHDLSQGGASYKDIIKYNMGLGGKKGDYETIKRLQGTFDRMHEAGNSIYREGRNSNTLRSKKLTRKRGKR